MRIKMFNESVEFEEIEDALLDIYDTFGEPNKSEFNVGDKISYILRWELPFSIGQYNGVDELEKITKVLECVKNLKSTQSRIVGYDVEFKISNMLFIRLTPISQDVSSTYNFFIKQDWRSIIFSYGEIAKFLKDRGFTIKSVDDTFDEYSEQSEITIITNATTETCQELANLINNEIFKRTEDESLDRDITCISGLGYIKIYPDQEKTHIELDSRS